MKIREFFFFFLNSIQKGIKGFFMKRIEIGLRNWCCVMCLILLTSNVHKKCIYVRNF